MAYYGGFNFESALIYLEQLGIGDVILPFILIFTIVFAVLEKSNILGDEGENKKYNTIVALVISLTSVVAHVMNYYPSGWDVINIINGALPNVSLVMIIIISGLLIYATFTGKGVGENFSKESWVAWGAVAVIIFIFAYSAGLLNLYGIPWFLAWILSPAVLSLALIIAIFVLIIKFVTGDNVKCISKQAYDDIPAENTDEKNAWTQVGNKYCKKTKL